MALSDIGLRAVYNHGDCPDLVAGLYEPLLGEAVRYDRTTYTFSASGLRAAAEGTAGLVRNGGRIRVVCDHAVNRETLEALYRNQVDGEAVLREAVSLEDLRLTEAEDIAGRTPLGLAYWLVANGLMEVKVAIRGEDSFHAKSGIVEDAWGNRAAFTGSVNETRHSWEANWESVHVYTSWGTLEHLEGAEREFRLLWENAASGVRVIDLPAHFREYIASQAPQSPPGVIREVGEDYGAEDGEAEEYWRRIREGLASDADSTAATMPARLWPHQERFRRANVGAAAARRLIADEVGLGKTLQAGVVLRTRLNQGRAGRALVIAPKAAGKQWQSELKMKFAIEAPIVDARGLSYRDGRSEGSGDPPWVGVPLGIAGHQWLVRNSEQFLATCGEYDIVIVDEAHRARFRDVDIDARRQPNQYLKLLRELSRRTRELLLLTATPMQLNEAELWGLLELLEPEGWGSEEYRQFYEGESGDGGVDVGRWKRRRELWRRASGLESELGSGDFLLDSDNDDYIARRLADAGERERSARAMERDAPGRRLMSRHTRKLLREYRSRGLLDAPVPHRRAGDVTIEMTAEERGLYEGIKPLVEQRYGSRGITGQALGFITTIFRKRMGSSLVAYAQTLRNVAGRGESDESGLLLDSDEWAALLDDADLDEVAESEAGRLGSASDPGGLLEAAEAAERLSERDSKRERLGGVLDELGGKGHRHILLFTQFRDTQRWLGEHLRGSGRHVVELYGGDGGLGDRGERLEAFRREEGGVLLCTETASESLNLQFCSAVVNYDIPWNPMTLEQRAGRIDRIGQEREVVDVVNLFYAGTAEHDAYEALARRFESITKNVGEYPPIIAAGIQGIIRDERDAEAELERLEEMQRSVFDINRLNADWEGPEEPLRPKVGLEDLERPLREPGLLPAGWTAAGRGGKHWDVTSPWGSTRRVTTDREAYENAGGRLEWWMGPWGEEGEVRA